MQNKSCEMKFGRLSIVFFLVVLINFSCKKDDDGGTIPPIEIRDRTEQQIEDKAALLNYLNEHYYNYSTFESSENQSLEDIIISPLPIDGVIPNPDQNKLLNDPIYGVETKTLVFQDTEYEIYFLRLNQGGGDSPNFPDKIRFRYEGFLLDNSIFDNVVTPIDSDLIGDGVNTFGLIPGWRKVMPEFNAAESFVDGTDGTVNYVNYGLGVMFIPSGLAYFSNATAGVPAYAPIIFKFELLQTEINDHDRDGIPSYLEDLNGDGEFTVNFEDLEDTTDDDTDGDTAPNYVDRDDDNDGILTINEDIDGDGDPTNDIGANSIPKYLDPEETESKV